MSSSVNERHAKLRLAQWVNQAIGRPQMQVHVRPRGNVLHILCEGEPCPDRKATALPLIKAMQMVDINTLLPANQPHLYQVILYGRSLGQRRPSWSTPLYLNQLEGHLTQLQQPPGHSLHKPVTVASGVHHTSPSDPNSPSSPQRNHRQKQTSPTTAIAPPTPSPPENRAALVVSTRSLAKRGTPDAIAHYLGEVLNSLGVSVRVNVRALPMRHKEQVVPEQRLWILCEAPYSPDPLVVAEPIAQRLRDLELETFRDAVVLTQVQGEPQPEWFLRVDLTPQTEMLREWARWGDVAAIARLLKPVLAEVGASATAELRGPTLHLFCQQGDGNGIPDQQTMREAIAPLLEDLAPQGLHAATVYGQAPGQETPTWVEWITLPANEHPALGTSTWEVAQQGDIPALSFLMMRQLNPDLEQQLTTGGIHIKVLRKGDLFHVMADAPVCPKQRQIGPPLEKLLRQLRLPEVNGIRIYGRRSGQKHPLWSYGVDFKTRHRIIPEAAPEFAASDAYVGDLLSPTEDEVVLRPDLTADDVRSAIAQFREQAIERFRQGLLRSQLFVPYSETQDLSLSEPEAEPQIHRRALPIAMVWGAVGLLLVAQTDWILGQILNPPEPATPQATLPEPETPNRPPLSAEASPWNLSELNFGRSSNDSAVFDNTGFTETQPETSTADLPAADDLNLSQNTDWVDFSELESPFSSFKSRQLDEKLALYYDQLAESGPPDVLILGSSRALRGVDPAALEQALAGLGYTDMSVFNFGINGATAQVFDFIIRQLLTPDQLPKLILIADGARAFNSGRIDITYNAIAVSEGYQELANRQVPASDTASADASDPASTEAGAGEAPWFSSYKGIEGWLEERLSALSASYTDRDRLKEAIQAATANLLTPPMSTADQFAQLAEAIEASENSLALEGEAMIDFDGFLPLSVQFNPATYYQNYARVAGDFDSDYRDFSLEGPQADAFEAMLTYARSQGVPVVMINTPLTDEYLDPTRMEHEQAFQEWMLRLAATEPGFIFRDLGQVWTAQYDYFSDPSHLNRYGAYQVSNRLAQDPMIPWPSQ